MLIFVVKNIVLRVFMLIFATLLNKTTLFTGVWCNGSTREFGSLCGGSSPSAPANTNTKDDRIQDMIDVNDIPRDLLDRIREQFERDPKVQQLRVQQQMLVKTNKFQEALEMAMGIDELFRKCVYEYLAESERQVETVDVSDMDMPVDDKEKMMQLLLVCFMCADMIESAVIGMDDVLHKYDKTLHMEMFNDIRDVMRMSEQKLKYLQENSGYMKDLVWADNCDNMYEMLKNKARSIMRKRNEGKDWGKNMEKFNK